MKRISFSFLIIVLFFAVLTVSQNNDEPEKVLNDVYIYEYIPFKDNSKAVQLNEKSNFTLSSSLPRLDGSTALYPVYASFVTAVYPRGGYDYGTDSLVRCSKTARAYTNLIEGYVDIIFCAEPSKEQIAMAAEKGIIFHLTPIGKDAFVFFVNKNNPVDNVSSENIRDIYSGNIANWKSISGIDEPIVAYQRPQNSGSQTMLESIMGETGIMPPLKDHVVSGMGGMVEQVAVYKNYSNAIGYSFLFFTAELVRNNQIKLLAIDGVSPSKATIQNDAYPFSGCFYAITRGDEPDNVKDFIRWMESEQGQYLVEQTGYVPIH